MLATVTQPLLGAVDTVIVGHLDDASYIAGVAIGSTMFSTLYWLLGFLRVSTSAASAQAFGAQHKQNGYYAYLRPTMIALLIGMIFLVLQVPLKDAAMALYKPESDVLMHAVDYFNILIWGAPFVLMGYVNIGWLMGRQYAKETMVLQISMNVLNIVLDSIFVFVFHLGVVGVAYGTLIAQIYGFLFGLLLISKKLNLSTAKTYMSGLLEWQALKEIMVVNTDLIIRTLCLLIMTNLFVAKGATFGTVALATNAILFQIQYIISYMFDGFANASSVFAGKAVGERNQKKLRTLLAISNMYTLLLSVIITITIILLYKPMIAVFTNLQDVIQLAQNYALWLAFFPFAAGIGLVYYGIFSGCMYTGPVRDSMILSLVIFLIAYFIMIPVYGNHGLWFSFILFSFSRSFFLYVYKERLFRTVFKRSGESVV